MENFKNLNLGFVGIYEDDELILDKLEIICDCDCYGTECDCDSTPCDDSK